MRANILTFMIQSERKILPHLVLILILTWWSVKDASGSCMQSDAHVYQPFWYYKNLDVVHISELETPYLHLLTDEDEISVPYASVRL